MIFTFDENNLCNTEGPFYGEPFAVIYFNQFVPAGVQSGLVHLTPAEMGHFPNSTPYFHIFRIGPSQTNIHEASGITGRFITEAQRQKFLTTRGPV